MGYALLSSSLTVLDTLVLLACSPSWHCGQVPWGPTVGPLQIAAAVGLKSLMMF